MSAKKILSGVEWEQWAATDSESQDDNEDVSLSVLANNE